MATSGPRGSTGPACLLAKDRRVWAGVSELVVRPRGASKVMTLRRRIGEFGAGLVEGAAAVGLVFLGPVGGDAEADEAAAVGDGFEGHGGAYRKGRLASARWSLPAGASPNASVARRLSGGRRALGDGTSPVVCDATLLILHWEERATEWSGKPDQITIQVTLYDVSSKQVLDKVTIKGQSKWATFGGNHPQDLLAKPIEKYVAELFGYGLSCQGSP